MPNTLPFAIGSVVTPHSVIRADLQGFVHPTLPGLTEELFDVPLGFFHAVWISGEPLVVVRPYSTDGIYVLHDRYGCFTTAHDSQLRPL